MTQPARSYRMGRRAEGVERTRERVVRVALELLGERSWRDVTLREVGRRAGVTSQTVLNHFSTKEGLLMSAVQEIGAELLAERERVEPGDVRGAVALMVDQYERYGDANVRLVAEIEEVRGGAELLATARTAHRAWLERIAGDRLPDGPEQRDRALSSLYAVTDVGTWKLLRRDLGSSREETETVLCSLVEAVLAGRADAAAC